MPEMTAEKKKRDEEANTMLTVSDLCVSYGSLQILDHISFQVESGQWFMIVGPNGAGKSTIVNAVSQGVPYGGSILWQGRDVKQYRTHELARQIGVLAQNYYVGYAFRVREVVSLGRYAYGRSIFGRPDEEGGDRVREALRMTGMEKLADKSVLELSGGELQRTFLAQLFAQNPRLLILDEPTNHLDLVYQKQTFGLIREWLKQPGRAVISVVHDLSLARAYGSHALLLSGGRKLSCGRMESVFTKDNLDRAFSMDVSGWMREMLGQWQ